MPLLENPPTVQVTEDINVQVIPKVSVVGSKTTFLIVSIVILCIIAVIFVLAMTFLRPEADNTPTILLVVGIIVPVITALLAAALQQVHLAVNSRLTELLELTAKSSKAEGIKEEKAGTKIKARINAKKSK